MTKEGFISIKEIVSRAMEKLEKAAEKGVHVAANFQVNRPGVSHAGISTRAAKINKEKGAMNWHNVNEARDRHKQVLSEMKEMPKPKLGKAEEEMIDCPTCKGKKHVYGDGDVKVKCHDCNEDGQVKESSVKKE
jgi:hypothetical protein